MLQEFLKIVFIYEFFDSFNPELSDYGINIPWPRNIKYRQKFFTQITKNDLILNSTPENRL